MSATLSGHAPAITEETHAGGEWNVAKRVAFRFCVLYFALYCLCTQIASALLGPVREPSSGVSAEPLTRPLVDRIAVHVFGISEPLVHTATASSDRTADWILVFCLLAVAVVGAAVWSVLDRGRRHYRGALPWFRLFLRFTLAGQLLLYGIAKIMLTQMPSPPLTTLVTPFGDLTPMGLLWSSVGAAPPYEIMIGTFEAVGGLLLVLPRTTTLGALLGTVGLTQVFALNLTYDVPVKIMSCHLLLMSVLLLAPEFGRILDVLLSRRPVGVSGQPDLFANTGANRYAVVAQICLGVWIAIPILLDCAGAWREHGAGRELPPLYGVWTVERMASDGGEIPPLITDGNRWHRVFFEYPGEFKYQRMDDSLGYYRATVDVAGHRMELSRYDRPDEISFLALDQRSPDEVILTGTLGAHQVEILLHRVDLDRLPLLGRGFHWVQDYPYNPDSR